VWGYAWVSMKMSLEYMGPFTFSALRFLIGALALLIVLIYKKIPMPKRDLWGPLIFLGLLQTSLVYIFVMTGMRFVEAGKSSVILYSMPLWSSLLATHFLKEHVSWIKWFGIGLGAVGLSFILGMDVWQNQSGMILIGEAIIVLAAIIWATSNVFHQKKFSGENQLMVTTFQMLFGTLGLFLAALLLERNEAFIVNATSIGLLVFTGVLASAFCFSAWFYLLEKLDTVTVTNASLLVPIFGVLFSWLTFGEPITIEIIIGAAFVLVGVIITRNDRLFYKKLKAGN
jgi:drug/metabolite transporter (DMT)-like permease